MNWIAFKTILLNLDHVISIDAVGKSLEICVEGSPDIQRKIIDFDTVRACESAFDQIKAVVMGKGDKECRSA